MELKRVELYNFSSYAGKAKFDFSTSKDKNIVLIGGNNGAGKTSLLTAIKLALYGPLCFRYQGKNAQYSARIKELMNHDAFMESEVKTYVEIEVTLPLRQDYSIYTIHREWTYSGQRVQETYWVSDGAGMLSSRDRDYFQNYLFTVIPPNMFEFFFFDGEEISNFFSDSSYNTYIKNAVLTLCGYDTFSIIKKFCDSYVGTDALDENSNQLLEQLHKHETALEQLDSKIKETDTALQELEIKRDAAIDEKNSLEAQFKKSGGLSKDERDALNNEIRLHDRTKSECSKIIRDYVEDLMPFYITRDLARGIEAQLPREDKMRQYLASTQQLSVDMLRNAIAAANVVPSDQIENLSKQLYDNISTTLCPEDDPEQFCFIHDLSIEQRKQVSAVLVQLFSFDQQDIITAIHSKKTASAKYDQASHRLRESLPTIDANAFFEKFNDLSKQISKYENSISAAQEQLERLSAEKPLAIKAVDSLRTQIQVGSKNRTAYEYTSRISAMMDMLISDAVQEKFKQIEQLTLQMFHEITHKENFIDLLELDNSFDIFIYKEQMYSVAELCSLIENVGTNELQGRLGNKGMLALLNWFNISSTRALKKSIKNYLTDGESDLRAKQTLKLYKRVELSQLSKGEKQVFLLSLYWAIIKSSGQKVPFIIDTPFARIDTEHREQLTKLFFPTVSNQVIVLSTDEEVVGTYHDIMRDNISHEYLLLNEESTGCTSVRTGYFPREELQ